MKKFFLGRVKSPCKHPEFIIYFVLAIIGVGAIGIHTAVFHKNLPTDRDDYIIANIATYFLAIIATGSIELIFYQKTRIKRAITLIAIGAIIASTFLFFWATLYPSYIVASIGLLLSLTIWWIANAENTNIIEATFSAEIRDEANDKHGKDW